MQLTSNNKKLLFASAIATKSKNVFLYERSIIDMSYALNHKDFLPYQATVICFNYSSLKM